MGLEPRIEVPVLAVTRGTRGTLHDYRVQLEMSKVCLAGSCGLCVRCEIVGVDMRTIYYYLSR